MPVESLFDARLKIDEADFERQIEAAEDISFTEELRLVIRDVFLHGYSKELDARKKMNEAKVNALRKARKALLRQVYAQHEAIRAKHLFPVAQNKAVDDWLAEGQIKVEA